MLKINGVDITTPKSFKVAILDEDSEDSKRNAKGDMLRDRIATKRKLFLEWGSLKMNEISTILKAVDNIFFDVNYPDPHDGGFITKTFYVSDRTAPMYRHNSDISKIRWEGLTMDFIEQ